jgi:hypothetical protein
LTKAIPSDVRFKVWRLWCGDSMNGHCFCCNEIIIFEKWHCGHIEARAKGGSVEAENLRPTCLKCNLGMGTMHMYEYIILNRLHRINYLTLADPNIKYYVTVVESVIKTGEKINWLEMNNHLNKTQANRYRKKIISKKLTLEDRVSIMEEVTIIYNQQCKIN